MRTRLFYLFFKQKTAYEMRISDWSSDVCSSDLSQRKAVQWSGNAEWPALREPGRQSHRRDQRAAAKGRGSGHRSARQDRKSVVSGKRGSVRVDLDGRVVIKQKVTSVSDASYSLKSSQNNMQDPYIEETMM